MSPSGPIDVRSQVAAFLERDWYSCRCVRDRSHQHDVTGRIFDWTQRPFLIKAISESSLASRRDGSSMSTWIADEAIELADQYLPPTPAITGRLSAPRSHRWYIAVGASTEKHTDPNDGSMIVELRSTGTQTVVGPSIHPVGEAYDVLDGEPAIVPAPMLAACVKALADAVIVRRGVPAPIKQPIQTPRPAADGDVEQRAIAYLNAMPPAISGQQRSLANVRRRDCTRSRLRNRARSGVGDSRRLLQPAMFAAVVRPRTATQNQPGGNQAARSSVRLAPR